MVVWSERQITRRRKKGAGGRGCDDVRACACIRACDGRERREEGRMEGKRRNAPAFERGQLAQLDPPKAMIAKRAQQRILLKTSAQRLRIERPDAPS